MDEQRIKFHTFLRGIILVGFTLFFYKLLLSNKISYFIAPKMYPFLYFTAFILLILGILQIFNGTSEKSNVICECCEDHGPPKTTFRSLFYYSLFIIPIFTGFLFSDHTLGSSVVENRQIQYETKSPSQPSTKVSKNKESQNTISSQPQEMSQKAYDTLQQSLIAQKKIVVDDKVYMPTMSILQENLDEFIGKEIETVGFVYREKDFKNNQIVIARFVISCCIADASVYGIMAQGDIASLENDTWIRVKGRLNKINYNDTTLPVLKIHSIEKIQEPKQPYVYDIAVKLD
ncbi:TIGR03943 family putative permease subunit [Heyndrickxia sp. NPDC080065]|uniref:TIGR03943 family putative permease subunit n=1 Tax=Heyndrickxia sp. NPDC080065 TaxID=3390568 RepID=UPI003D060426